MFTGLLEYGVLVLQKCIGPKLDSTRVDMVGSILGRLEERKGDVQEKTRTNFDMANQCISPIHASEYRDAQKCF